MSNVGSRSARKGRVRAGLEAQLKQAQQSQKTAPAGTCEKEIRRIKRDTLALMEKYQRRITLARAACALLCAAAYIVRVQNERALKQVCDFDSVHFAGRIWFDFKSGIRA